MGTYFWVFWGLVDREILIAREAINAAPNVEQAEWSSSSMKNEDVKRGMK
jgi:hypothetical protein